MNNGKRTLVIITPGFPKDEADDTCLPMQQEFVRSLTGLYPDLNILLLSIQYPYTTEKYQWHDVDVIPFDGLHKRGLSKWWLRRKIEAALKKINQAHQVIGLLSFWCTECALIGKRFADKKGIPHFCWILGQDARKDNAYVKKIHPKESELVALSDFLQDEFERNHGIRPHYVIAPGIDRKQFPVSLEERPIDILAAGSLIPLKQYDVFIDIIGKIKLQWPGIKAELIGNGPEKERLQSLVKNNGLQDNITMRGELPHAEVLKRMQKAKLFLHPSSYEGFSGVCLEALAAGTPVISFCKAMREDIAHWHIVDSPEKMKDKAIELLKAPLSKYEPLNRFEMRDTARKMIALFIAQPT